MPVRPVNWRGGEVKFAFPPHLSVFKNGKKRQKGRFSMKRLGLKARNDGHG